MVNAAIQGMPPLYGEIRMGLDGQLWRWVPGYGQETVASGGDEAVAYAIEHGFPENVVELIRSKGLELLAQSKR